MQVQVVGDDTTVLPRPGKCCQDETASPSRRPSCQLYGVTTTEVLHTCGAVLPPVAGGRTDLPPQRRPVGRVLEDVVGRQRLDVAVEEAVVAAAGLGPEVIARAAGGLVAQGVERPLPAVPAGRGV